ncbi:MAG: ATP-binding protein [Candidatus Omnitrophota bacterium]
MNEHESNASNGDFSGFPYSSEAEQIAKAAERALIDRPRISVRLRISLVFLLCFVLTSAITVSLISLILRISEKQKFLETISNFQIEILLARRFEKNFFLYNDNLNDALDQIARAAAILKTNADEIRAMIGGKNFEQLRAELGRYQERLQQLFSQQSNAPPGQIPDRQLIEQDLRLAGADILRYAKDAIDEERNRMHVLIHSSITTAAVSLGLLLLFMVYMASFLARQLMRPLSRLEKCTQRIAGGDFSPIAPARKYRDEFSNLTMAMNAMIYELKIHQDELAQSRKMAAVGTLTSGIAHELNNPLNNISLTVESLLEEFGDYGDDQKKDMLRDISTQVERASGTVRNLLDFTRIEQPAFVAIRVKDMIDGTMKLIANEAGLNHVDIRVDVKDDLPLIEGNPRNLQQVFLNIGLNAIQAMPEGGTLTIRANPVDEHFVQIDVEDTGVGIPAANLDKIFDPFFTTKEVGMGTGLGLSVSYRIIQKHKGKILAKSQEGAGTTFSVFLPYQAQKPKEMDGS